MKPVQSMLGILQKLPAKPHPPRVDRNALASRSRPPRSASQIVEKKEEEGDGSDDKVRRNELGVQLLSRKLHTQLFPNVKSHSTDPKFIRVAQDHLRAHGLDPAQAQVLPSTSFDLPPLQGRNLDEHFHRIGLHAAQPWLQLAKDFTDSELPPRPEFWDIQSGWTKYHYRPNGASFSEHVPYPNHSGNGEEILAFDVETMPAHSPFAVMACAASKNAWYAWISPWLLGESEDLQHLIPLGDPTQARLVVGHNVSYDRARILEEYHIKQTKTRFMDTMALHVAVKGISSHQRPAWMKYRKSKAKEKERKEEAAEVVVEYIQDVERQQDNESDAAKSQALKRLRLDMEESLPQLLADDFPDVEAEITSKRWEDITSANSLADLAGLYCGTELDKEIRNDFMTHTPAEIRENVSDYLTYCAQDVFMTHAVFARVLPDFLKACPHPVSFAGILTMGSSFLTTDRSWERYLENAERTYRDMEEKVKTRLLQLAEEARGMMESGKWKEDVWLSQLDWTPKRAGKSRGVEPEIKDGFQLQPSPQPHLTVATPDWLKQLITEGPLSRVAHRKILPLLFKLSYETPQGVYPLVHSHKDGWHYERAPNEPVRLPDFQTHDQVPPKCLAPLGKHRGLPLMNKGTLFSAVDQCLALAIALGDKSSDTIAGVLSIANRVAAAYSPADVENDPWLKHLDWTSSVSNKRSLSSPISKPSPVLWPAWYWELAKPKKDVPPGTLALTPRSRVAPLLLRLSWLGWPLFHSREHGWMYRVPSTEPVSSSSKPRQFHKSDDDSMQMSMLCNGYNFYKLPHKDGEGANVGSPLGKTFVKYAQGGPLTSPGDEAREALEMNAQCSYWISARDRILNQMVLWQGKGLDMGVCASQTEEAGGKFGIILPQVITMGAVTRRAIEKTWLTASNAKATRVGSELKAMIRAPPGYAIVGADVDSEELWISSCMGDAQFGLHGATALGWMTLEGTKAAGTDLHSKTASILGLSRDQAKIFNYSRIYGSGMRHAMLLLQQSNVAMRQEDAQKLAEHLYASTKGKNTRRPDLFGRKFWHGGSESFVFNKLEEIALSVRPLTPALGCGITYALSKEHLPAQFGSDYLPSRINWVVQSSGVDYLHLLIASMEHLLARYQINARYLISVHDELRYLVAEEDRYRAALALQIANLWTRCLFAYKLGIDDLPQGVAFFSAVDIDHVLRKEVDMTCVTPSQPTPIPPGESLNAEQILLRTNNGSLWKDGRPVKSDNMDVSQGSLEGYTKPNCHVHRAKSVAFLQAQATTDFHTVKKLALAFHAKTSPNEVQDRRKKRRPAAARRAADLDRTRVVDEV